MNSDDDWIKLSSNTEDEFEMVTTVLPNIAKMDDKAKDQEKLNLHSTPVQHDISHKEEENENRKRKRSDEFGYEDFGMIAVAAVITILTLAYMRSKLK